MAIIRRAPTERGGYKGGGSAGYLNDRHPALQGGEGQRQGGQGPRPRHEGRRSLLHCGAAKTGARVGCYRESIFVLDAALRGGYNGDSCLTEHGSQSRGYTEHATPGTAR